MDRTEARELYRLADLYEVETGHRRRPSWSQVVVIRIFQMIGVGVLVGWCWLLWQGATWLGSSIARLWMNGGGGL